MTGAAPRNSLLWRASSSSQLTQARGAKQLALVKKSGVAKGYISSLDSGEKKNPGIQTLKKLARAVGVPVGELLE